MKKSGKKLAITAILAGFVIASMSACQKNAVVYGPPEDYVNEADSNADTSRPTEENADTSRPTEENADTSKSSEEDVKTIEPSGDYDPEENLTETVYGPPSEY